VGEGFAQLAVAVREDGGVAEGSAQLTLAGDSHNGRGLVGNCCVGWRFAQLMVAAHYERWNRGRGQVVSRLGRRSCSKNGTLRTLRVPDPSS